MIGWILGLVVLFSVLLAWAELRKIGNDHHDH
jgi:hypothetical protein